VICSGGLFDRGLRLATLMADLGLPERKAHNPVNDTTIAALALVKLRALLGR